MLSKTVLALCLLASSTFAQSPVQSAAVATATGANDQDTENLVHYLLPSAAPSSLTPAQASRVAVDASDYFIAYTSANPVSKLQANAVVAGFLGATVPSGAQQSSIGDLLGEAGTAALANPSGYVQSLEDLVQPFGFAGQVTSYAEGLFDGLRTVIASDLSVAVPTPTTTSSKAAAAGGRRDVLPTGVVGAAAAAVLGVAGMYI